MPTPPRTRLLVALRDRADFEQLDGTRRGELFIATDEDLDAGESVSVEVRVFGGLRLILRGTITRRRGAGRAEAGIGVRPGPEERAKMAYLRGYVRSDGAELRSSLRLPLRLPVSYAARGVRRTCFTRDLNARGAFLRAARRVKVGTATSLRFLAATPGRPPTRVQATVAWHQTRGDRGFGVRFVFASAAERGAVVAWVRALERDFVRGRLPDDVLG